MAKVSLNKNKKKIGVLTGKRLADAFKLPTSISIPSEELGEYTMIIFGEGKIGKTSLISHFPKPYYLMFEAGGRALSILQSRINTWDELNAALEELDKNRGFCQTVVIDTGYGAYEMCYQHMLDSYGVDDYKEAGFNFWKDTDKAFKEIHDRIIEMGFGLVVTAHCDEEEITKHGMTRHKTTLQLGKQATRFYKAAMDIIGYYHYTEEDGDRVLTIGGDEFTLAGTRTDGKFLYTDGSHIKDIPMGSSSKEAYQNLIKAFNCGLVNPNKKKKGGLVIGSSKSGLKLK